MTRDPVARLYRFALRLYPSSFRRRFGDEMADFAATRLADARSAGPASMRRAYLGLIADVMRTAPIQWTRSIGDTLRTDEAAGFPPRDNMDIIVQDLKFSLRSLLKRPAFTLIAAITLALGVGANTAIFSVVNAVLIRSLPYENPDQLVIVWGTQGEQRGQGVSYADYLDWRARNRTFTEMGVFRGQSVNLTGGDTPERLIGSFVSASFLRAIGAKLSQGRGFTDTETEVATKAPVAIVSYEAWQSRFGADPALLGKSIVLNGTTFTVIGITAPKTAVPLGLPDVMVPVGYYPNAHGLERGVRGVAIAGRLKPNVTATMAQRDLDAIAERLAADFPTTNAATGADVVTLRETVVGRVRDSLLIILAATGVVLLIACANVANLQLARGAARARELSVRAALGAGRRRIAQQLLTESVLLSLAGGIAGIGLAVVLKKALVALVAPQLPVEPGDIRLDTTVLLFAFCLSVFTGVLFGLVPAWKSSRADLNGMLRSRAGSGLSHAATRNTLVVVQLALSLTLLTSAGLITRSLVALEGVNPGFDGDNLLTAQFRLAPGKYDSPEKIMGMFDAVIAEIRAVPGVEAAALVRASPLSQNGESYPVVVEGKGAAKIGDAPQMLVNPVTSGYFAAMRIPILAGRDISDDDRAGTVPVIVVNKSFADATWPGESAIGKRVKIADEDYRVVIGVAGDTKHFALNEPQLMQGYVPHAQRAEIFTSLVVRTHGNPLNFVKSVRAAINRVDRDQPVWRFKSMQQDLDDVVGSKKTMMWLTALFAIVALLVAAVGIYGVLSYTMSQRTAEVGVRIALGADARQVTGMVVAEGMRLIAAAVVVGLLASLGSARLLRSQLFGVAPNDLITFGAVTVILSGVAILACYIPARRASKVNPMIALRAE